MSLHRIFNMSIGFIKRHRWFFSVVVLLHLYLIPAVYIPFIWQDKLQLWDVPGHLFAIKFLREHLLPNYTGWNPYFYAGYPQDTFYPPLYHYTAALLSFIFGYNGGLKLIHIASVSLLPCAFYFFARRLNLKEASAAIATAFMLLPVIGYTLHTGGTLYSLFYVGLGANAMAIPLLFWYLGVLVNQQPDRWQFHKLTALLSAIILTHYAVTIVAGICLLLHTALHANRRTLVTNLGHAIAAVALTAFWLIPFLVFAPYYGGSFMIVDITYFITLPILLLIGGGILLWLRHPDQRYQFPIAATLCFSILVFFDFIQYHLPIHPYRFIIYFLLFAMILPTYLLFNQLDKRRASWIVITVAFIILYHVTTISTKSLENDINSSAIYHHEPTNIAYTQKIQLPKFDGRMVAFNGDQPPHIHDLRTTLVEQTDNRETKGLFIESSANGRYVASIHANAVRGGFVWGTPLIPLGTNNYLTDDPATLQKAFDLFQITHILLEQPLDKATNGQAITVVDGQAPYHLYQIGSSSLVEAITQQPATVTKNWDVAVTEWLKTPDRRLLVYAAQLPANVASTSTRITIIDQSPTEDYLRFAVDAPKAVPILIKSSYFPRWKAYANGQPITIYRAAPYLMLVYGTGTIELRYGASNWDYLGYGLSILTLLGLGYLAYQRRHLTEN